MGHQGSKNGVQMGFLMGIVLVCFLGVSRQCPKMKNGF